MQVNISTRHGDISDATKEKIVAKVEKLKRFFERLMTVDVTIDLDKADEPKIEVFVKADKQDFVAQYPPKDGSKEPSREKSSISDKDKDKDKDLFPALDSVVSKLEQQIKKHKEKLHDRGRSVPEQG